MNTFWLKMAALTVVVIGLIILVNVFSTSKSEPKPEPKTVYDVWEEDDKRLRAEPKAAEPRRSPFPSLNPLELENGQTYIVSKQTPLMPSLSPADPMAAIQQMKQIPKGGVFKVLETVKKRNTPWYKVIAFDQKKQQIGTGWINSVALLGQELKKQPVEPPKPKFRELSEIEIVEAERLFEFAMQQRKIGRLPVTGFKPMVDACREIMQKFPGSEFDYKARRMLADIPKRFRERYKITKEEIDLTKFYK